jgi:hypothetical protein
MRARVVCTLIVNFFYKFNVLSFLAIVALLDKEQLLYLQYSEVVPDVMSINVLYDWDMISINVLYNHRLMGHVSFLGMELGWMHLVYHPLFGLLYQLRMIGDDKRGILEFWSLG